MGKVPRDSNEKPKRRRRKNDPYKIMLRRVREDQRLRAVQEAEQRKYAWKFWTAIAVTLIALSFKCDRPANRGRSLDAYGVPHDDPYYQIDPPMPWGY